MSKAFVFVGTYLLCLGATVLLSAQVGSAPPQALTARVDELFGRWDRPDSPGCAVGIRRNGVTEYERAYGSASLELSVPLTNASVFPAASISKQFTAMSIMLLAERGRLSLEDPARKYLPELPDYGTPLTIRHLLDHTSGLRDVFLLLELSAPEDLSRDQNDVLVRILARQRALNFEPGRESLYNNGGYVLLAEIVERVSGQTLAAFARENIFVPLGMTSTRFDDDPAVLMRNRVSSYAPSEGAWRIVARNTSRGAVGNSGVWTTTRDLLRWADNVASPRVGSARSLAAMQVPSAVSSAEAMRWGLGFEIAEHNGAQFVGHGGGDRGIDNYFAWYPRQRLAIAVLCNSNDVGSRLLTQRIADLYLPARENSASGAATSSAVSTVVLLPTGQLEAKAGLYRMVGGEMFVRVFVGSGGLRGALGTGTGDSFALVPVSPARFAITGTPFAFEFSPPGIVQAAEMRSFAAEGETGRFTRLETFRPSSDELRAYVGTYASDELAVEWTLAERNGTLTIQRPAREDTSVEPLAPDMFTTIGDYMAFARDASGNVTGFTLVSNGVRSLRCQRVVR